MNCDKCQELISDLLDGSLNSSDQLVVRAHLNECLDCASVHRDLSSIVAFCSAHRGEYDPVPNQQALWLRIRNIVEAEGLAVRASSPARKSGLAGLFARSWEFSLPQLAAFATSIVVLVSLVTVVGLRRWETPVAVAEQGTGNPDVSNISDRMWQQQQVINYWNQRIEVNKVRWSPQMRETFDRNMKVIDQAVSESLNELQRNPHDEVSEQMLNDALNDKLSLLKEFSDL
jgi:anti-sigma factor RsiW